jgi:hypothetical protein
MADIVYWTGLMDSARRYLATRPHVLPVHVLEAVELLGGIGPFVAAVVPQGDPVQADFMVATVMVCQHLFDQGLGWVPYVPPDAVAGA